MSEHYILIGQTPVPCDNLLEWAMWFETADRRVAYTDVLGCRVSTVFLCLDQRFLGGAPLLFETMACWEGEGGNERMRCSTWDQAERMHAEMCRHVASPCAVACHYGRLLSGWWQSAWSAWSRSWRELRGIEPSEIESLAEMMIEW